jgi:DNA-binding NarL/FixJ family response regulator
VLVVDDHCGVREAVGALLDTVDDTTVVGTCADGWDAMRFVQQARPDVVVMDVRMPGMDGAEATRALLALNPRLRVVLHTAEPESPIAAAALAAGASACVAKSLKPATLLHAVLAPAFDRRA